MHMSYHDKFSWIFLRGKKTWSVFCLIVDPPAHKGQLSYTVMCPGVSEFWCKPVITDRSYPQVGFIDNNPAHPSILISTTQMLFLGINTPSFNWKCLYTFRIVATSDSNFRVIFCNMFTIVVNFLCIQVQFFHLGNWCTCMIYN